MHIPFIDLKAQYSQIKSEIDEVVSRVLSSGQFVGGDIVEEFEQQFAQASNIKHCVAVGNGTDALYIALIALGIKEGDEVITTASSWISTASTILKAGATPIFVDIEKDHYTIDVRLIEEKISDRTKAIIPVHLYGQMADMAHVKSICDKHYLYCIEDSAQAHFAQINDKMPGKMSDAATFSFYPTKNLGAYGDGGSIITNNDEIAKKCRTLANYGIIQSDSKIIVGGNSRLDTLQAAILNVKLKHVNTWIDKRIIHAKTYNSFLQHLDQVTVPKVREGNRHTYYAYVIRCERRDELKNYLQECGITTAIHYPSILPLMAGLEFLEQKAEEFPVATQCKNEILSLPMYAELTNEQIAYIANCISDFYN
jgi:dTDP-4-amino-4,6-dideoxygalactose transaminase